VLFQTIKKNWEADHRPLQFEDPQNRPDDLYRKRHLRQLVDWSVAQLPEHHRVVFVLRELEGKTYEEIADITGCNLGTVKSPPQPRAQPVRPADRPDAGLSTRFRALESGAGYGNTRSCILGPKWPPLAFCGNLDYPIR